MKNNETGEFELVVGDRQLLSAFFIVVLLCAVAFALGYVVGQNVPKTSTKASAETVAPSPAPAASSEVRPQALPPAPQQQPATPGAADTPAQPPADPTPQPTTQPAQGSPEQAASQQPAAPAQPAAQANGLVAPEDIPSGNFWQVMAVAREQAEIMRTTLQNQRFPVILSPAPKGLTRVLVGPYADSQSYGKAKTDLENTLGLHPLRYKP